MMRKPACLLALASTLTLGGCLDEWLTTEPQDILTDEQLWSDGQLIVNVLSDYYDRLPIREGPHGGGETGSWGAWDQYDEGIISRQNVGNVNSGNLGSPGNYGYGLIRDIHVAMEGIAAVDDATLVGQKARFLAELRFLRAYLYFDMVKRHGGVPLITERMVYTGDNLEELQVPRAAEAEIYDFIFDELMAIKGDLPRQASQKTRATWGTAMALISRSQLYAGSIATHNYNNPNLANPLLVTDPNTGKLVAGIPQSEAAKYYQRSLEASDSLISGNSGYSLRTGANPSDAFHSIFVNKSGNNEVIFVKDFAGSKEHWFGMRGRPASMKVDGFANWGGSEIGATLNVVENFDKLDGTSGPLEGTGDGTPASQANWIFYDTPGEILEGYDGRLHGTVLGPGGTLGSQGSPILQRGVYTWSTSLGRYVPETGSPGEVYDDDPAFGYLTGLDGVSPNTAYVNSTGFFIKKYLNPDPASGKYAPGDYTWVVYFRLGEIYMNAAEAALQLGQEPRALGYINTLRQRAGFPANSLTDLTMEKIQSERWSELAYEDHRLWDLRRWRIAHVVWDGVASNPSARLWVLNPYRIYRPGHAHHNKWVFDRQPHLLNTVGRNFGISNYYSALPGNAINNNPLLVQNTGFEN